MVRWIPPVVLLWMGIMGGGLPKHRDGEKGFRNGDLAVVVVKGSWSRGSEVLNLVLVDPHGRKDVWQADSQVSAIPGCVRDNDVREEDVTSDSIETGSTMFELSMPETGEYRLVVRALERTGVIVSVEMHSVDGNACGAEDGCVLASGKTATWTCSGRTVAGDGRDTCLVGLERIGKKRRKG